MSKLVGLALLIAFCFLFVMSVVFRVIVTHPASSVVYAVRDIYHYFKYHYYNRMETGKLICYTALFGGGKTLSCVHYVSYLYRRYNNKVVYDPDRGRWVKQKVHIISNVDLNIPFEHFENMGQIVRVADRFADMDKEHGTRTCTVVLGDEFSVQMNSRSFKTNIDPLFLNTLLTCRHHHIMMIYNAQRFNHVDALLRQVTSYVIECRKVWRVMVQSTYDAYVLENTVDPTAVKPLSRSGWFITDRDFSAYDTLACVGNLKKSVDAGDMETEIEIINRQNSRSDYDLGSVKRAKKTARRRR